MKKTLFALFCFNFAVVNFTAYAAANDSNKSIFDSTDDYLQGVIASQGIVGLNYAVLIDNQLVHHKSFGVANAQLHTPLTQDHVFPVASISKLFSSVALHKLLEKHNRHVDETLSAFLPHRTDLPKSWRALTLKQLLSHTSGMPDQIDYQVYLAPESEAAVIEVMRDKPFTSSPGSENKYNATGFLLIRMVIEALANQDFETHMQTQYFDKFALASARYGGFKQVIANRVTAYRTVNEELQMFPLNYSAPMYAGAGLNINIQDLVRWFQTLQQEQILKRSQLESIWTPVPLNKGQDGYFGLGWEASRLPDNYRMTGHGGAGISSFRHYWNDKSSENVTVIVLTNGARDWTLMPHQINAQLATMIMTN